MRSVQCNNDNNVINILKVTEKNCSHFKTLI